MMRGALILCGICSILSYAASFAVARFMPAFPRATRVLIAGLLPTGLYVIALIAWHLVWLRSGESGYSPLVLLIYGWWLVGLNLVLNLIAAGFPGQKQ